jgi:hypothetical protein
MFRISLDTFDSYLLDKEGDKLILQNCKAESLLHGTAARSTRIRCKADDSLYAIAPCGRPHRRAAA